MTLPIAILNPWRSGSAPLQTPLATADFVNGVYTVGGSSVAAASVVDKTSWISSGTGLVVPDHAAGDPAKLLGTFATILKSAQWLAVMDVDITIYPMAGAIPRKAVILSVDTGGENYYNLIEVVYWGDEFDADDQSANPRTTPPFSVSRDTWVYDPSALRAGVHRIAVNRNDNEISIAADNNAALVGWYSTFCELPDTWDPSNLFINVCIGGYVGEVLYGFTLRSLNLYSPLTDHTTLLPYSA